MLNTERMPKEVSRSSLIKLITIRSLQLTLVAHSKQVVTTLEIAFIRFLVSCITLSTFVKVAALPTVWSLTVNCNR